MLGKVCGGVWGCQNHSAKARVVTGSWQDPGPSETMLAKDSAAGSTLVS